MLNHVIDISSCIRPANVIKPDLLTFFDKHSAFSKNCFCGTALLVHFVWWTAGPSNNTRTSGLPGPVVSYDNDLQSEPEVISESERVIFLHIYGVLEN